MLKAELSGVTYPFLDGRRELLVDVDPAQILDIAEKLALVLVGIGSTGEATQRLRQAVERVKHAFVRGDPRRPVDEVLLFLVGRHRKGEGASLVREIARATRLPDDNVRQALRDLESDGIVHRILAKVGDQVVWYFG